MAEYQKIETSEKTIGSIFLGGIDGICALLDLTVVGAFFTPVIQGAVIFCMDQFFFKSKGGNSSAKLGKQFLKYASNIIPVLPTLVTIFWVEVSLHNNQRLIALATKAASAAPNPTIRAAAKIATKTVV